jgi:hypothetical protein
MTVIKIITEYLEQHKFDGLYQPGECACLKDDLAPCGQVDNECEPGYRTDAPEGSSCKWHIGAKNSDNECYMCCGE